MADSDAGSAQLLRFDDRTMMYEGDAKDWEAQVHWHGDQFAAGLTPLREHGTSYPWGLKNSFFGRARVSGGLLLLGRCLTCDQLQRAPRSSPGHPC